MRPAITSAWKRSPRPKGEGANPFIDSDSYKKYVAQKEQNVRSELAEQKAVALK
jgi:hypothetical protein